MLVTPAPIVAYIVCFTYLDSSTIKSQLPELVHSFTVMSPVCAKRKGFMFKPHYGQTSQYLLHLLK